MKDIADWLEEYSHDLMEEGDLDQEAAQVAKGAVEIRQLRAHVASPAASEGPFNAEMPSSLNDACRRLDLAQERISQLEAQVAELQRRLECQ